MVQMFQALSCRLRRWAFWLLQQEGTPGQRARGLAAGVFSGCFPFFGLQTLFGVLLATLLRGNRLLAATATWISNPFTYLSLYWLNYQVGSGLLGQGGHTPSFSQLSWRELFYQGWAFSSRLILGSTLVGAIAAGSIGGFAYALLRAFAKQTNRSRKHCSKGTG